MTGRERGRDLYPMITMPNVKIRFRSLGIPSRRVANLKINLWSIYCTSREFSLLLSGLGCQGGFSLIDDLYFMGAFAGRGDND